MSTAKKLQTCPIPEILPFTPPTRLRVLRRCTLILSDPAQNHRLAGLTSAYDILALRPTNEKSLQLACSSLDCDLISLDLTTRFDFHFKMKMLAQAIERGIKLEMCYSPGILAADSHARRNLISNATQLIRATRGRGLVISSEASRPVGCRGPWDVINLAAVWGLGQERGKEAVSKLARSVVVSAQLKRTSFRGAVDVVYGGEKPVIDSSKKKAPAKAHVVATSNKRKIPATETQSNGNLRVIVSKREQKRRKKAASTAAEDGTAAIASVVDNEVEMVPTRHEDM